MEKKLLIRFLNEKRKGSYKVLTELYSEQILSLPVAIALELIREDLKKECGEPVELNYFSLARAVARFKKKSENTTKGKLQFKDSHELGEVQSKPGKFKLG